MGLSVTVWAKLKVEQSINVEDLLYVSEKRKLTKRKKRKMNFGFFIFVK